MPFESLKQVWPIQVARPDSSIACPTIRTLISMIMMLLEKPVGTSQVKDRRGVSFPIVKEGKRDLLLNSVPTIRSDKTAELAAVGAGNQHFIFTLESAEEAKVIAEMYRRGDAPKAGMKFMRIAGGAKK